MEAGAAPMTPDAQPDVQVPENEWQNIQKLADQIMRRSWEQDEDLRNLNNLLHALHGECVRDRKYTPTGKPSVIVDGEWVPYP
jgi:hypothetical protein